MAQSGITLERSVLGRSKAFEDIIFPAREMMVVNTLSIIGGIYFVFINAVKMDKDIILRTIKSTWNVSLTVQLVPLTISIIIARLVHDNLPRISKPTALFYISFISAETYFAVTADAISELNLLNSELGQLTISTAVLHEILGWLNNALSPLVRGGFAAKFIKSEISFLAFLIFTFFVLRPAIQWIIRTTPEREPVKKCYIVAILIGALIMAGVADIIGSNFMIGAAMMGLVIPAGPPLGSALVEKSEVVIRNFFLPFLFIRIGLLTDIFSIKDWKAFVSLGMILVAAYLGKVWGSLLSLIWFKTSTRNALLFGCFLNIKGIIELLVFLRWIIYKVSLRFYPILLLSFLVKVYNKFTKMEDSVNFPLEAW